MGRPAQAQQRTLLARVQANGNRLATLIEQLLDFSQLERGLPRATDQVLDLGETVRQILTDQPELPADHRLELTLAAGCHVRGSQAARRAGRDQPGQQRRQVLPRRHHHHRRRARRRRRRHPAGRRRGPGVPAEDREKVFSRFYRGHGDAVARTRGAGIGLAIVAEYAASMSGHARVSAAPGGGARFSITFPLVGDARAGTVRRSSRCRGFVISSSPPSRPRWWSSVAVSVVLLLRSANDQGIQALTRAKLQQVQASADSFNARAAAGLSSVSGLGAAHWQLTMRSPADAKVLATYNVDKNAQSGFFLIDAHNRVTNGVLLRPGRLGSIFDPPGWAKARRQLETEPSTVLPVSSSGLTTELPEYDLVVAIRGAQPDSVRGALVFETALTADLGLPTGDLAAGRPRRVHLVLVLPRQQRCGRGDHPATPVSAVPSRTCAT